MYLSSLLSDFCILHRSQNLVYGYSPMRLLIYLWTKILSKAELLGLGVFYSENFNIKGDGISG